MRIDIKKMDLSLARAGMTDRKLRSSVSAHTLTKIRRGEDVKPFTVGRIARALGVDPADILVEEDLP